MTWTNPVTEQMFDVFEEYVESLAESYKKVAREKHQVAEDEKLLVAAADAAVSDQETRKGTFRIRGTAQQIKVTRRQTVGYDKTPGQQHPLRKLMQVHPQLGEMVTVEYKEKGSGVSDLISKFHDHALHDEDDRDLVEEILKVRTLKDGKPGIAIEDRKDVRND